MINITTQELLMTKTKSLNTKYNIYNYYAYDPNTVKTTMFTCTT